MSMIDRFLQWYYKDTFQDIQNYQKRIDELIEQIDKSFQAERDNFAKREAELIEAHKAKEEDSLISTVLLLRQNLQLKKENEILRNQLTIAGITPLVIGSDVLYGKFVPSETTTCLQPEEQINADSNSNS